MSGHGHPTSIGDYAVHSDGLHGAAGQTRAAAKQDTAAARTFAEADADPGAFGRSGPAADLARKWHDAVRSRAIEAAQLADRTNDMATQLDATAGDYQDQDHHSARLIRAAA
jgi:hypothetical protein